VKLAGKKGMSLPEVLIAVFILSMSIGGVMSFYMMTQKTWVESKAQTLLARNAGVAMDFMTRGVPETDGIRGGIREAEAESVTCSGSTIVYTSGIDSLERRFYLSGSDLIYDPDTNTSGDEYQIVGDVSTDPVGLGFTLNENKNIVTIKLDLESQEGGITRTASLSTRVYFRN